MPDPQPPEQRTETPATRRQRRSRIAAVGASLGAAVILTGGLALANQTIAGSSTNSDGSSRARTVQTPTGSGSSNGDDGAGRYGGDDGSDDGGWFSDDDGGGWTDSGSGASRVPDQSRTQQPSTSSGGS